MNPKQREQLSPNRRQFIKGMAGLAFSAAIPGCGTSTYGNTHQRHLRNNVDSPNFKNGTFHNPIQTSIINPDVGFLDMSWRWMTEKTRNGEPQNKLTFNSDKFSADPDSPIGLKVMWLGHSTVFIEIDGKRFLFDPMWSENISPVGIFGPTRFFNIPLRIDQLPKLDGVIISHNHLDHLDYTAIKPLAQTGTTFYCPLGVGEILQSWDISDKQIKELDWWETISIGKNHQLVATPARHFSGRGLFDRNKTLWASWALLGKKHRVFFGGDGGPFSGFKTIGEKYGPFDMTFLEIGAYDADWPDIHLGPESATQAQIDLRGNVLLPIHWGTFKLAFHPWTEPVEKLIALGRKKDLKLALPRPGQWVDIHSAEINTLWWNSLA